MHRGRSNRLTVCFLSDASCSHLPRLNSNYGHSIVRKRTGKCRRNNVFLLSDIKRFFYFVNKNYMKRLDCRIESLCTNISASCHCRHFILNLLLILFMLRVQKHCYRKNRRTRTLILSRMFLSILPASSAFISVPFLHSVSPFEVQD